MIRPPGTTGIVFSQASDGDMRGHADARKRFSSSLGVPASWAWVRQVHGNDAVRVSEPGDAGDADALWTSEHNLPVAIYTADCLGVILVGNGGVGVAHAGWRGAAIGVVSALRAAMSRAGAEPENAYIGPGIDTCCFEVGPDVAGRFVGKIATTTWDNPSVDLVASVTSELVGIEVWAAGACTYHEDSWFSHRRDQTLDRMAAVTWIQ